MAATMTAIPSQLPKNTRRSVSHMDDPGGASQVRPQLMDIGEAGEDPVGRLRVCEGRTEGAPEIRVDGRLHSRMKGPSD